MTKQLAPPAAPNAIRLEVDLGDGRKGVVVLPTPVTDANLFHLFAKVSAWYTTASEAEHPKSGILLPTLGLKI